MTSNTIYRGAPTVTKTTAKGYGTVPGTDGHWFTYTRALLPTSTTQIGWLMHFKLNTTLGQTLPLCGWSAGYGSLIIASDNTLGMYVRKAAGQSIGNARLTRPIPNLATGRWVWVYCIVDIPSAGCHYYYCYAEHAWAWTYLGAIVGTFAGGPLTSTNSDVVLVGSRGTSPWIPLTWDYFAEYVNGAFSFGLDLRERDAGLPAGWATTGTATFTPRTTLTQPPAFKDVYAGTQRVWPLRAGQPLTADGVVDIYQGSTKVWPKTGEARWNVSQYDDGTTWAS